MFVRVGTLNARNGREVFVNRRKLAVGHVEEERPPHDLQFAAVKGKRRAAAVRCSSTVGVPLVHVHTGSHDGKELAEGVTFWLAGGIRSQVAEMMCNGEMGVGKPPKSRPPPR